MWCGEDVLDAMALKRRNEGQMGGKERCPPQLKDLIKYSDTEKKS